MATFTVTSTLGDGAVLTKTFDDSAMKLRRIQMTNNTNRSVRVSFDGTYVLLRDVAAGGTLDFTIPTAQRPTYSLVDIGGKQLYRISGVSSWFGIP